MSGISSALGARIEEIGRELRDLAARKRLAVWDRALDLLAARFPDSETTLALRHTHEADLRRRYAESQKGNGVTIGNVVPRPTWTDSDEEHVQALERARAGHETELAALTAPSVPAARAPKRKG
jgi:hypothetical protein